MVARRRDPYALTDEENRRLNERTGKQVTLFAWWFGILALLGLASAVALLVGLR